MRSSRAAIVALLLAALMLGTLAARSHAGTYDVYACNGGPDNSWVQWADPGMAAYDQCPHNSSTLISGMIARASVGTGSVGYLQGAYQAFAAPPGASLAQLSFYVGIYRWETHWTAGIVAYDGDFNSGDLPWGCYASQPGCGFTPGSFYGPVTVPLNGRTQVRIESRCGNRTGCTLATTGYWPYTRVSMALANVAVRVQDFTQPAIDAIPGGLNSDSWIRGVQDVRFGASDNVGIRETRVRLDGREVGARGRPCDYSQRVPCPQGGDTYSVDTATARPDGLHTLTIEGVDTAGNVRDWARNVLVDNSAPAQPQDLRVDGGESWRSRNDFQVSWRNPPPDGGSPIAGVRYELCRSDGSACDAGEQAGAGVSAIEGLRVPVPGEYVLRVWLKDEAGNEDSRNAGPSLHLRFDDEAPDVAFERSSSDDPTRVSAAVSDRGSGIAGGEIWLRRAGTSDWRPLATSLQGGRLFGSVDDEGLRDGVYVLRVRAFDRAGNERSSDRRTDGEPMEISLPLRIATRLRASVRASARARGKRRPIARGGRRTRLPYGRTARVSGQLTFGDGNPVQFAELTVLEMTRSASAMFRPVGTVRTTGTGSFTYRAAPGTSRRLRFRYSGSSKVRPATADIDIFVSASSSFRVSRRVVLNGESVVFQGKLRGGSVPAEGKLVEVQAYVRGRWRTFTTTRTGSSGAWNYAYRFDGTRGRQVYSFRLRVPREAAFPYETGHSRRARVTVIGL